MSFSNKEEIKQENHISLQGLTKANIFSKSNIYNRPEEDPKCEIVPCLWVGAMVRLPLYHHAFMLMDLLSWGEV